MRRLSFDSPWWLAVVIFAGVVILGTLVSLDNLARRDGPQKAIQRITSGSQQPVHRDNREMAYIMSQTFIKRQLMVSSMAEFPPPSGAPMKCVWWNFPTEATV